MGRLILAVITILLLLGLIGCIIWASMSGSVLVALRDMIATPWGATTLFDLFVGLGAVAVWIALLERKWQCALLWIVFLPLLGNVVTLIYFTVRLVRHNEISVAFLGARVETNP